MTTKVTLSGLDHSNEGTSTSFYLIDLTAANFTAQGVILGDMQTAIQGVSLIAYEGATYPAMVDPRENTPAANVYAQRESKWKVNLVDTVTQEKSDFEIGGADLSLLAGNTQFMDVSGGAGAALVTAIETNVRSRAGNTVSVASIQHVGRSN